MDNIFSSGSDLSVNFSKYDQDLLERFRSRLLYQFKASTILDQFVQSIAGEAEEVYRASLDVLEQRTLMTAKGVQLDVVGDLVGQPRPKIDGASKTWFTADANRTDNENVWCDPASLYENTLANDDEYRGFIIGKIFKNQMTSGSIPELRFFTQLIINIYDPTQVGSFSVSFMQGGPLDLYLVVKETIKPNILTLLTTVLPDDKKCGQRYFLPLSATSRLLGVVFLPVDNYGNCIGFMPDSVGGRCDYAEAAITITMEG
jgi:hypothetical protein